MTELEDKIPICMIEEHHSILTVIDENGEEHEYKKRGLTREFVQECIISGLSDIDVNKIDLANEDTLENIFTELFSRLVRTGIISKFFNYYEELPEEYRLYFMDENFFVPDKECFSKEFICEELSNVIDKLYGNKENTVIEI